MVHVRTPRGAVLGLLLVVGLVRAEEPLRLPPTTGMATVGSVPEPEPVLKDLTPPEFVDLIPHDEHEHHAHPPGHLEPVVPDGHGFFAQFDYLLMRPRADGRDFAVLGRSGGLATDGPLATLRDRLGNGFRAELGYRLPGGGLDASFAYTHLRAWGNGTLGAEPGQVLFPTLTRPGLTDTARSAVAASDLDYNVYDALGGKRWALDDHVAVRGFAGVRFADIRQDFRVRYDDLDARLADVCYGSRFRGAGPTVGAEAVYAWPRGFHLYARGSGGLLSGLDEERRRETNDDGRTLYADTPLSLRKVVPTLSLGVGGGFQYRSLSLRAGYEVTHWFGITDRVRFASDVSQGALSTRPGNLSLDGLFLQLGLTF